MVWFCLPSLATKNIIDSFKTVAITVYCVNKCFHSQDLNNHLGITRLPCWMSIINGLFLSMGCKCVIFKKALTERTHAYLRMTWHSCVRVSGIYDTPHLNLHLKWFLLILIHGSHRSSKFFVALQLLLQNIHLFPVWKQQRWKGRSCYVSLAAMQTARDMQTK